MKGWYKLHPNLCIFVLAYGNIAPAWNRKKIKIFMCVIAIYSYMFMKFFMCVFKENNIVPVQSWSFSFFFQNTYLTCACRQLSVRIQRLGHNLYHLSHSSPFF